MPTSKPQTDFDEGKVGGEPPQSQSVPRDVDGVPYCQQHHCRMRPYSGGKKGSNTTHYKCSVAGCDETAKMIRTSRESVVPPDPVPCPRCSTEKKPVICSRNQKLSTAAYVILECPECTWRTNAMASPHLVAQEMDARSRSTRVGSPGIGDR